MQRRHHSLPLQKLAKDQQARPAGHRLRQPLRRGGMIGAAFILTDPIFQGLVISLVFGPASSTALTLLVIPAIYVWLMGD